MMTLQHLWHVKQQDNVPHSPETKTEVRNCNALKWLAVDQTEWREIQEDAHVGPAALLCLLRRATADAVTFFSP
jgi:hypothetical protein